MQRWWAAKRMFPFMPEWRSLRSQRSLQATNFTGQIFEDSGRRAVHASMKYESHSLFQVALREGGFALYYDSGVHFAEPLHIWVKQKGYNPHEISTHRKVVIKSMHY
jgi:hypothetical protein